MNCLFCKIIKKEIAANILYEDDLVMCIMDAYPEVDGHSLVIPKSHYEDIYALPDDTLLHINNVAKKINTKILAKLNFTSSTLSINYGYEETIKHFHLHILPNFHKKNTRNVEEIFNILNEGSDNSD